MAKSFRKRKIALSISGALLLVAAIGAYSLAQAMRRDLRADMAWMHVGAPPELRSRAMHWYPLSYPVLDRWTHSDDGDRAAYAFDTIVRNGGPAARFWLDRAVERNDTATYFPGERFDAYFNAFGLTDKAARTAIARRAASKVVAQTGDDPHFDEQLLGALGPDALDAIDALLPSTPRDRKAKLAYTLAYNRDDWTATDRQRAKHLQAHLPDFEQSQHEAMPRSRLSVAAERLTKGDPSMLKLLAKYVNEDLRAFNDVDYMPNLIRVAAAFPDSRLSRGYRAYDALRGDTYFDRSDTIDEALPVQFANVAAWRTWLHAYSDHPGADDASYWLGRSLQAHGERVAALRAYADALERQLGDGDMRDVISGRFMWMLDAATTDGDMQAYAAQYPHEALTPLVNYARAVRAARAGTYAEALAQTGDQAQIVQTVKRLGVLYNTDGLAELLAQQRAQWRQLTAASPEDIAKARNAESGWRIGYLAYFNQTRGGGAGYMGDSGLPAATLAQNMRAANRNAQNIAYASARIAHETSDDQKTDRRRIVIAYYRQLAEYPDQETEAMGKALWSPQKAVTQINEYVRLYPHDDFTATALLSAFELTGETAYLRRLIKLSPESDRIEEAKALLWRATHTPDV